MFLGFFSIILASLAFGTAIYLTLFVVYLAVEFSRYRKMSKIVFFLLLVIIL